MILAAVAAGSCSAPALAQTPPAEGYHIVEIGLTGEEYEYASGSGFFRSSTAEHLNHAGQVAGHTLRHNDSAYQIGADAWLYDGTGTRQIGLIGDAYEYTFAGTGGGTYRSSDVRALNAVGQVLGTSARYNPLGRDLGADAWLHYGTDTHQIGLTGNGYEYAYTSPGGGIYRSSEVWQLNDAGQAVGYSRRFNALGVPIGRDAWLYTGTTTIPIGLAGDMYEFNSASAGGGTWHYSEATHLNEAGQVAGYANRHSATEDLGRDAWVFTGTTTVAISLTGSEYEYTTSGGGIARFNNTDQINAAGQVVGTTQRHNASGEPLGYDTWIYTGTETKRIGLVGSGYQYNYAGPGGGIYRRSWIELFNDAGHVVGGTLRINASEESGLGEEVWIYDGTATIPIGLTGGDYEVPTTGPGGGMRRVNEALLLNDSGQVVGRTGRIASNAGGWDVWIYNGTNTLQIGLTGDGYESILSSGITYRVSQVVQLNEAGQVIGRTGRRSSTGGNYGQAGWFYDAETNITTPLEFNFRTDGVSNTDPTFLTEDGVVLGSYTLWDGMTSQGRRAFWWSLEDGFYDLGALVADDLTDAGWQYLSTVYGSEVPGAFGRVPGSSPYYILGTGRVAGQTGGDSVFRLTAVPEPGSLALMGLASLVLARRRRHK